MKKSVLFVILLFLVACAPVPEQKRRAEIVEPRVQDAVSEVREQRPEIDELLAAEQRGWEQRIQASLEVVPCGKKELQWPSSYYRGKLIDTHYHIPPMDDATPGEYVEPSEQPALGRNVKYGEIMCTLEREGTAGAFGWFAVYPGVVEQFIDVADRAVKQYPNRVVPFIMPPDDDGNPAGYPTVDAELLDLMLSVKPGLFRGYGEIGLYAREDGAPALSPDDPRLLRIYSVLQKHGIKLVYFHLGEGQQEAFERVLDLYPDLMFIFHGDQLVIYRDGKQDLRHLDEILSNHPNAYYGVDELYNDVFLLREDASKEDVLAQLAKHEYIQNDVRTWRSFIERHPDQVMWGTDRGWSTDWTVDYDVGKAMTEYSRDFIGRLSPEVQERFAYKNAERLAALANVTFS